MTHFEIEKGEALVHLAELKRRAYMHETSIHGRYRRTVS